MKNTCNSIRPVEHPHHQKIYHPRGHPYPKDGNPSQASHIGRENQNGCQELEKCPVDTRIHGVCFIEQYHRRIKIRQHPGRTKSQSITAAPPPLTPITSTSPSVDMIKQNTWRAVVFLKGEGTCHGYDDRGEINS